MVPDPGRPGWMRPLDLPHRAVCGERYAEGAVDGILPSCDCGTFAIGTCQSCGAQVCGEHAEQIEWVGLVCKPCARAKETSEAETAREQVEKAHAVALER